MGGQVAAHQPPSFLGTTPRPEQRVFGRGGEGYGPAMTCLAFLGQCCRDDVRVCAGGGQVTCSVCKVRAVVADAAVMCEVVEKLADKAFVRVIS